MTATMDKIIQICEIHNDLYGLSESEVMYIYDHMSGEWIIEKTSPLIIQDKND